MRNYHNIERINGRLIGYSADGRAWRITGKHGNWSAYANVTKSGSTNQILMYNNLSEISFELETVKCEK